MMTQNIQLPLLKQQPKNVGDKFNHKWQAITEF